MITENPDILGFDNNMQAVIKGEVIKGSNVIDLFNNLFQKRKKGHKNPKGHTEFVSALKDINVPHSLIAKSRVLESPKSLKLRRPPGRKPHLLRVYNVD
jgi:hypothetical protein